MLRVRDRNGKRVRGICGRGIALRQKNAHHHGDLRFFCVTGTDDGLLHEIRRIFRDFQAGKRGHGKRDAARMPEP